RRRLLCPLSYGDADRCSVHARIRRCRRSGRNLRVSRPLTEQLTAAAIGSDQQPTRTTLSTQTTLTHAPDSLHSLRDSFALHLDATRAAKTRRIYLASLDALIRHLEAAGMPTKARAVRREHVESYFAA